MPPCAPMSPTRENPAGRECVTTAITVTCAAANAKSKTRRAWYYRKLTEVEITQNKLLNLVSEDTPPAFLAHAYDDDVCKVEETTLYAQKLFDHNVPVEMHLFPRGGHGFGMGRREDGTDQWVPLFVCWLISLQ